MCAEGQSVVARNKGINLCYIWHSSPTPRISHNESPFVSYSHPRNWVHTFQAWTMNNFEQFVKQNVIICDWCISDVNISLDWMSLLCNSAEYGYFFLCQPKSIWLFTLRISIFSFPHFLFVHLFLIDLYYFSCQRFLNYECCKYKSHNAVKCSMFKPSQRKLFVALSVEIWNIYRFTWEYCTNCCNDHRKQHSYSSSLIKYNNRHQYNYTNGQSATRTGRYHVEKPIFIKMERKMKLSIFIS